jgi:hypothetical protein
MLSITNVLRKMEINATQRRTDEMYGTNGENPYMPSKGIIAVSDRLLLKLDGSTARVLRASPLHTLREFGVAAGLSFSGAVALDTQGLVVTTYVVGDSDGESNLGETDLSNVLECWNCKNGKSVWRLSLQSSDLMMAGSPQYCTRRSLYNSSSSPIPEWSRKILWAIRTFAGSCFL